MIYTLTFSPAVDYIIELDNFELGKINRSTKEDMIPGGKGINVSFVLATLGRESIATGFLGGFTGDFIRNELTKNGVKSCFVKTPGNNRINIKIRGEIETAINGSGPVISNEKIEELIEVLKGLKDDDILVISGTIPTNLPENIYEIILERLKDIKFRLVVDAEKKILLYTLRYKPFLVKPNFSELEAIFNVKIDGFEDTVRYARKLLARGALNVIVSLGRDGAILVNDKTVLRLDSPGSHLEVISTVGAGDSLVAGFIDEYLRSNDMIKALKWGLACGTATCISIGLAKKEDVIKLYQEFGNKEDCE